MGQDGPTARLRAGEARLSADVGELIDYCARPTCRKEFRRTVGPGRRRAYCSEFCRRSAEKELRQARSRLSHFEDLVQRLRVDVAAFGRADEETDSLSDFIEAQRKAEDALNRVEGILTFMGESDDRIATELRRMYMAVAPVVQRS